MFAVPSRNNGPRKGTVTDFARFLPVYHPSFIDCSYLHDSSLPGAGPPSKSFRQLGGRQKEKPLKSSVFFFFLNNQPKIIYIPKRHILELQILLPYTHKLLQPPFLLPLKKLIKV